MPTGEKAETGGEGGGKQGGVEWNVTDLKRREGRVSFKL